MARAPQDKILEFIEQRRSFYRLLLEKLDKHGDQLVITRRDVEAGIRCFDELAQDYPGMIAGRRPAPRSPAKMSEPPEPAGWTPSAPYREGQIVRNAITGQTLRCLADSRPSWPPADPSDIRELRSAGNSDAVIARAYGRSSVTVLNYRRKHGIFVAIGSKGRSKAPEPAATSREPAAADAMASADPPAAAAEPVAAPPVQPPAPSSEPARSVKRELAGHNVAGVPARNPGHMRRIEVEARIDDGWSLHEKERLLVLMTRKGEDRPSLLDVGKELGREATDVIRMFEHLRRHGRDERYSPIPAGSKLDYRGQDHEPGDFAGHYEPVDPADGIPRPGAD